MVTSLRSWFDRLTTNGIFCSELLDRQHRISPRTEFFAQSCLTGNIESHHERNFLLRAA